MRKSSESSNFDLVLTLTARRDVAETATYIRDEKQDPSGALRWLTGLAGEFRELRTMPRSYPRIPEASEVPYDIRQTIYHSHRIVFVIDRNTIVVLRVYHGARRELNPLVLLEQLIKDYKAGETD